jgi:hypothetical protein
VDTKADEARYAAREAFKEAVDRLDAVLQDGASSDEQIRAAEAQKVRALGAYNQARGVTDRAAEAAELVDGAAGMVAHPVQTAQGVGSLIDSLIDEGRPCDRPATTRALGVCCGEGEGRRALVQFQPVEHGRPVNPGPRRGKPHAASTFGRPAASKPVTSDTKEVPCSVRP